MEAAASTDVVQLFTIEDVVVAAEAFFEELGPHLKPEDVELVRQAFVYSNQCHMGQTRKSGEPYITHPLAVAQILSGWFVDAQSLAAALLHDVMEDTGVSKLELTEKFGRHIADLVDGLSKLDRLEFQTREEAEAENFRKMLLAMARDVRVILIKLADRLHNMRTLDSMREDKRKRIAAETLEIYAPIANRIGLHRIFQELEDLCFEYLHPHRYQVLSKAVKTARGNRREIVSKILDGINKKLKEAVGEAYVYGREKNLYSIYRKMQEKHLSFSEVLDIYGFRVIVADHPQCYLALGALHALYKPIPGKFKDYIAIPKANGYQSLHTTLFGPYGPPIEVQIRTSEMHELAESGVAAHWKYKTGTDHLNEVQQRTHQWLERLLDIQSESRDSAEFLENVKVDLFPDEVYVFTPNGKIMSLPSGSTSVDFAYAVHTDIGNQCVAAKINYELMPLRTRLNNGDRVEIITSAQARPNPSWLNFVVTGKARSSIRHNLKTLHFDESVILGERLLIQALEAAYGQTLELDAVMWDRYVRETGGESREQVLADIGLGKRLPIVVAKRLLSLAGIEESEPTRNAAVTIRGTEGMAVQFARCCHPIPGDPILGLISKGQGLVIHTHDCPVLAKTRMDHDKVLDVAWDPEVKRLFPVRIKIWVMNQRGTLAQIASCISEAGSNIENVAMEDSDDHDPYTSIRFTIQVENRYHLAQVLRGLRQQEVVVRIHRVRG